MSKEDDFSGARQQLQRSKQKGNAITITSANRVPRLRQKSRDTTWTARDPHNQNTPLAKQKPANRLEQSTKHTAGCLRAAKRTLAFHDKTNKYIINAMP
eukprot:1139324-Pelagomonas_calceolata.AAC.4